MSKKIKKFKDLDLKLYTDVSKTLSNSRIIEFKVSGKYDFKLLQTHNRILKRLAKRLKISTLNSTLQKIREVK